MTSGETQNRRLDTLRRADALIEMERWSQALQELAPLLAGPDDFDALCRASQALLGSARNEEAAVMAGRAIYADPTREWAHRLRSRALLETSSEVDAPRRAELLQEAAASAREAVRLAPASAVARLCLGQVSIAAGAYTEAASAAAEARNLDPNSAGAWVLDGCIALAYGRNDQAEQSLRRALEIQPNEADVWNTLGVAIERQGRWREATAAYLQSARLDPLHTVARQNVFTTGFALLRTLAVFLFLAVMIFVPFGEAIAVGAYAAILFLCRPKGLLRRRTEMVAIRVAMLVERLPFQRKLSQFLDLRFVLVCGVVLGMAAIYVFPPNTPVGVGFLAVAAFGAMLIVQIRHRRRSQRSFPPSPSPPSWPPPLYQAGRR